MPFAFSYTERNQLKSIRLNGQASPIIGYAYDATGNMTGITRDNGTSTALVPDAANRITSITHNLASGSRTFEYVYNEVNNLKAVRRDGQLGDGYEYDFSRQITGFKKEGAVDLQTGSIANPANNLNIAFDPCGNRVTATNSDPNLVNLSYAVNQLNQYTGISESGGPPPTPTPTAAPTATATATATPTPTPTATPTATSTPTPPNPTPTSTPPPGPLDTPTPDPCFPIVTDACPDAPHRRLMAQTSSNTMAPADGSPTYDPNGNLTGYKDWTYTYDAQNRLISATNGTTTASFSYDGKNRQIARNINGTIRFSSWDGWELLEEYSSGLNVTTGFLQGATGVIKSRGSTNTIYYYQDKLSSTSHVADAGGQLLESYKYGLSGTPSCFNSASQPINASIAGVADLYAGERYIPELQLYDLRNRFMSPELGRFLQSDPIGFKGDASNLYRYCGNDPIDKGDPMGLENPPARVIGGTFWAMEKFWDTSCNFQGDFNQFLTGIRPQAGMDNGGGGSPDGGAKSVSRDSEGNKKSSYSFVPTDRIEDLRYHKYFYHQLHSPTGKALAGYDYYAQEKTVEKVNKFNVPGGRVPVQTTDNDKLAELPRSGLFKDRVGLGWQPTHRLSGTLILEQHFLLKYKGREDLNVSTVLRHITTVTHGSVNNSIEVVIP
jgi:RHS repeat-associated protein